MSAQDFADWLRARSLDLHWSWTRDGDVCLSAIRGKQVWNGTAKSVDDAIQILQLRVEGSWPERKAG